MRKGMTLLELLFVLGVIALLVSLMFTGINRARHQGYLTACLNNLRQLHLAVKMYENDWGFVPIEYRVETNDGYYGWVQQILYHHGYVKDKNLFLCPADPHKGQFGFVPIWQGEKFLMSYGYLVNSYTISRLPGRTLTSQSVLFGCHWHLRPMKIDVLVRYDGSIELAPFGRYKFIGLEGTK